MTSKKLSAAVLALIAAGAGSAAIFDQFIGEREGNRLMAYRDAGGMWTICRGLTRIDGQPVVKGMRMSEKQCRAANALERDRAIEWVKNSVTVPLTEPQIAGIASFCYYNLGETKCRRSTFWKKLNAGDRAGACAEIKRWVFDQGRDCRLTRGKKDGCYGQVTRRDEEAALSCWELDQ